MIRVNGLGVVFLILGLIVGSALTLSLQRARQGQWRPLDSKQVLIYISDKDGNVIAYRKDLGSSLEVASGREREAAEICVFNLEKNLGMRK